MQKLFILLLCIISVSTSFADEMLPVYQGTEIDLTTYKAATLYKGADKQKVADNLNVSAIYNIVSKQSDQWTLKLNFRIEQNLIEKQDVWLQLRSNIDAAEITLNGHPLLQNGKVGDSRQTEQPGKSLVRQQIPRDFLQGDINTLTVRFSNFNHQHGAIFRDLSLGRWIEFESYSKQMSTAPLLFAGIFLFAIFVNMALFYSLERKPGFALLALLYTFNFVLMAHQALYWNGTLSANHWFDNYSLMTILESLIYFALLLVLHAVFKLPNKHLKIATLIYVSVLLILSVTGWPDAMLLSFIPLLFGIHGARNMAKSHWPVVVSLALIVLFEVIDEYNLVEDFEIVHSYSFVTSLVYKLDYFGMILFALTMIFVSARDIFDTNRALSHAELKLERLEFQFVQKHIQPHFLMNTLMSLQQLVHTSPATASQMIDALSEEFHLLTIMSKQQLVPIEQEIEMCRTHLTIMSIQQNAQYQLHIEGITFDEQIPPAVFHTLVENGITHGYVGKEPARFVLTKTSNAGTTCYRMFNDGRVKTTKHRKSGGSGIHYIEARLEEWQPGLWTLTGGPLDNGWETVIEIKAPV